MRDRGSEPGLRPDVSTTEDRGRSTGADRGVSTVVNYTVALVVVGILVSGLLVGTNGFVAGQTERVVRSELSVVGNHLASDIATADRLAGTVGPGDSVAVRTDLVDRVVGEPYAVDIASRGSGRYALTLTTEDPAVSVTVFVETVRAVETGRVRGGDLTITFHGGATRLEVSHV